jgi:hypothetical protein
MKRTTTYLACLMLTACGTIHTNVGPKPDIKPVMASNKATQKEIAATRTQIKSAQVNFKTGTVGLEAVKRYLEMLTGLPPKQEGIVLLARKELDTAMSQFAEGALKIAKADARAEAAEIHALNTEKYAEDLSKKIDAAHKREEVLAKDNLKMKPVYELCTKWWDLGAFVYGFKQLFKHLLILGAVVAGIAVVGLVLQLTVLPTGFFSRIFSVSTGFIHRGVTTVRSAKRTVEETRL